MTRTTLLLTLSVLVGCPAGPLDKDGELPYCEETPTVVDLDEVTELGFTAQDLLDLAVGTHDETFAWARGGTTPLTQEVTYDGGEARFVAREAVYPEGDGAQPAIGVICDDTVEVDVSMGFSTDDGAFAEVWELALDAVSADTAQWNQPLDPDGLTGTYDMDDDITEPDWDERSLWASGSFDATGSHGEVGGQVSGEEDCTGDTCAAWAAEVAVGTWGASE
jgi:hypothetical protein